MRVTVVQPGDLGPSEADLWARFQKSQPAMLNPFLSLTFAQTVGRARPAARIAVIEDGGEITAFLPFELAPRKIAMPIGYPMNDLQGLVSSGAPVSARSVVRRAGLRGWRFTATPTDQRDLMAHCYRGATVSALVIDLAAGYRTYLSSRSRPLASESGRKRRALARQQGPVALQWSSSSAGHLRQLIAWKADRYGGARQLFSDPTAVRIIEELAAGGDENCRGIVNVLLAGERLAAINLGILGPTGLTGWFLAYDPGLSRFSPGTMMVFALAEEAANRGITRIELGNGQDRYKSALANTSYPVAGGAVWASRAEGVARSIYRRLHHDRLHRGKSGVQPRTPPATER
jgi:CelD/BcsL family acetyltransferase involved in cellulose biosynthesis